MSENKSTRIDPILVNERIMGMVHLVKSLRSAGWDEVAGARNEQYIRIRMKDYKAVSLNNKSALCRFVKGGAARIGTILKHFDNQAHSLPDEYGSRERRLQAWIIKQALLNKRDLLCENLFACIKSKGDVDELIFALDEISFGDVRCDIFAVGKKGGKVFPVVIELKYDRQLATLVGQLNEAVDVIQRHSSAFKLLLEELSGREGVSCEQAKRIIVWPEPGTQERDKTRQFRADNREIIFIEYGPREFNEPCEVGFSSP